MPEPNPGNLRDRLLAQEHPWSPARETYERRVEQMLERETNLLARERRWGYLMWPFFVLLAVTFLVGGGYIEDPTRKLWLGIQALVYFTIGGLFILRYYLNRNRLELMKEMKQIQLRLDELETKLNR